VALFVSISVIAALVVMRMKGRIMRVPAAAVAAFLSVMLVLCKSLGALVYAVVLAPVVLFTRPRVWTKIACAILLIVCAYPALRWHGLVPVEQISRAAGGYSADRSSSFDTRAMNESQLLSKAQEKPFFGWGMWGRNRIYDEYTGKDISISDGEWVIEFGTFGWLGYLSLFGLFAVAGFRANRAVGSRTDNGAVIIGGLSLLLAVNVFDLLPNSNLTPLTFLLAGSIASASKVRVRRSRLARMRRVSVGQPQAVSA
jgi:cell division protein FtsW (lipid II flippase)